MKKAHRAATSAGCRESRRKKTTPSSYHNRRSLTKGLKMGLVNNIYVNQGSVVSPTLSDKAKGKYLRQLSLPMRNSIGLTYPLCSSIGMTIEQSNKANCDKYTAYKAWRVYLKITTLRHFLCILLTFRGINQ